MAYRRRQNPEVAAVRILQKKIVKVTNVIKGDNNHFNNRLKEEGLVSGEVFDPEDKLLKRAEYATALYNACITAVKVDSSNFSVVMDVLSEYPLLEQAVQEMTEEGIEAGIMQASLDTISPPQGSVAPSQRGLATPTETILTYEQLAEVMRELPNFTAWRQLGENVGLVARQLDVIRVNCKKEDVDENVRQVLEQWLKRNHNENDYGPPTWSNLANALIPIDRSLAMNIQKNHCPHQAQSKLRHRAPQKTDNQRRALQRTDNQHRAPKRPDNQQQQKSGYDRPTDSSQRPNNPKPPEGGSPLPHCKTCMLPITLAVILIAVAGLMTLSPWQTPSPPMPCNWPEPNSNKVLLEVRQVTTALSVKEISDHLKTLKVQVGKAVLAGDQCNDTILHDKMKVVDSAVVKFKERVRDTFKGFSEGATMSLIDLKASWDSAVGGKKPEALRQVADICKTTDTLAKQVDTLKGFKHTQADGLHQAKDDLVSYQEQVKNNHERQLRELDQEKQRYVEDNIALENAIKEAEGLAHEAKSNAQKENEAWEELRRKHGVGLADTVGDHMPFEERREKFLKDQQHHEAKAEENKRTVYQNQVLISKVDRKVEKENLHFTCTDNAIGEMKEAVGVVDKISFSDSLFQQNLKKDCEDLLEKMELIDHYWFTTTRDTTLSQVCDKAVKLFTKWQALLRVSEDYVAKGNP